jgi:hypothetical protein
LKNEGAYAWINHRDYGFLLISSNRRKPIFQLSHRRSMLTPAQLRSIARIAARIGPSDRSISALEKLLSIPYELQTRRSLRRCSGWIQCLIHSAKIHMEFTRGGGLPETGYLPRAKIRLPSRPCRFSTAKTTQLTDKNKVRSYLSLQKRRTGLREGVPLDS